MGTSPSARAWGSALGWLALGAVGHVVALQLIEAGPQLRYQHYSLSMAGLRTDWWRWGVIVAQTVLVWRAWQSRLRRWPIPPSLPRPRLLVALVALWTTSAIISHEIWKYPIELTAGFSLHALAAATIGLGVLVVPHTPAWAVRTSEALRGGHEPSTGPTVDVRGLWMLGCAVSAMAALLNLVAYERHPHVPDEVTYLFHARYFAEGRLWLPLPPVPEAFDVDLLFYTVDRWFSPVQPGWPAMLAAGVLAGVPSLVNPVLAGVNVCLLFALCREWYSRSLAWVAVVLLALSPWHLFLAMSYMSHTFTLTLVLLAALALSRARRRGSTPSMAIAGALAGAVFLVRPLDGAIVALVLGGLSVTRTKPWKPPTLVSTAAFILAWGAAVACQLPYNAALTGDPLYLPVNAYFDKYYWPGSNAFGFGSAPGAGWANDPRPGHSLLEGIVNTWVNASQVETELHGWATGSLIAIAALFCLRRGSRTDAILAAVTALAVVTHVFYWYSGGPDFGARYWFLSIAPLIVLSARGVQEGERALFSRAPHLAGRVVLAVSVLCVLTLLVFVPWRAVDKYRHFREMRPEVRELAARCAFGRALVLVRGTRHADWASAAVYNELDLRNSKGPVYAWDRSEAVRAAVVAAFRDRPVWVVNGPSLTGRGFEVVEGPLPPGTAPREAPERAPTGAGAPAACRADAPS